VEEEYEGEDYDDVDEDLKAQILGRNETEQEEQTTTEEGNDKRSTVAYLHTFFKIHLSFHLFIIYIIIQVHCEPATMCIYSYGKIIWMVLT